MKQQKMKQLALLGLASGLLAATSAQAAERTSLNEGLNRSASSRPQQQPVAGCGGKSGCGAVADNFAPSGASCARPQSGMYPDAPFGGAPAEGASCGRPQFNPSDPQSGELIQAGCAPHQYSVNDPNEQYDPERHGRPMLSDQQQPQSTFRYIGDASTPPAPTPSKPATAARPQNNARYLSDMSVPPSSNTMPPSSYTTPSSTSSRPQGSPPPFSTGPSSTTSTNTSPSPYSPQPPHSTRMNSTTRVNEDPQAMDRMHRNDNPPSPRTESARKTFW